MDDLTAASTFSAPESGDAHWIEHLRVPALSLGTYSIRAGGIDDQTPHGEDEIYVVVSGRGAFEAGERRVDVEPGSTLFVPAFEEHRFVDITEDLTLVVVFAPAEGTVAEPGD
jgi:quercetin dioxygenase-like cupin family protein